MLSANQQDDSDLLQRICTAYGRTIERVAEFASHFDPTPWWQNVRQKHLNRVQQALRSRDIPALHAMYSNFFFDPCGKGLVLRPPNRGKSGSQQLVLDAESCLDVRENALYRIGYWRAQTNGRFPISVLCGSDVGNPFGPTIEGVMVPVGAEYHHACAERIVSLSSRTARVVEIGGGYGHMAYFLVRAHADVKYVDFDVPESLALAAYYLGQSMPAIRMLLYGEAEFTSDSLDRYDVVLMPPWEMRSLGPKSVDVTFSSYALCDVTENARELYLREIARFTRGLLIDICGEQPGSAQMLADSSDKLFTVVERRGSDWTMYRDPKARQWETVYRPRAEASGEPVAGPIS